MNFEKEILSYEKGIDTYSYKIKKGKTPIIFTAVHTVPQVKVDGIKPQEPFTGAICQYVANKVNASYLIKSIDNGIESNAEEVDEFKEALLRYIRKNNIKLLIDLHGAKRTHDFDVEFGTLSNLTVDLTTQNALIDCFRAHGIEKIAMNDPFKGGGITKYIYANTDIDIIQIEINKNFRDKQNLAECEKICKALVDFAKKHTNFNECE